jgi:tetrahydromethanopterin S-methyltransferase subunit B
MNGGNRVNTPVKDNEINSQIENLSLRIDGMQQRVDNVSAKCNQDLESMKSTLNNVETRVNQLPTLEDMTNENSPLAKKQDLHETNNELNYLKGKFDTNFWGIIATNVTIVVTFLTLFIKLNNSN